MAEVTRNEIEDLQRAVRDLAGLVHTLQELAGYHDEEIKALQQPLRDPSRVHSQS